MGFSPSLSLATVWRGSEKGVRERQGWWEDIISGELISKWEVSNYLWENPHLPLGH